MNKERFYQEINKKNLYELIRLPFYLINIIKIFKEDNVLPNSKSELFQKFIDFNFLEDIKHYKTTIELEKKKSDIILILERIALTMEILGRNLIYNEELNVIIKKEDSELIQYFGLFQFNKIENYWEFQHNNFQEFLVAKLLSNYNLDIIKKFISFPPDHKKIIPSWVNTLSFLSSMYRNNDLINWLLESQPELLVKFEKDRIIKELRIKITKEIFNYYKSRKIWIDWNKFNLKELGKFSSDDESIDFLIEEVKKDQHYIIKSNSIELLGFVETNFSIKKRIIEVFLNVVKTSKEEVLITRSLNALTYQNFNNKDEIENILIIVDYSGSQHIRACLYHLIAASGYSNYFVDFLINGIQYIRSEYKNAPGRTTLVDEGFYLSKGIEDISSEESIVKLLEYYIKNPKDLSEVSFRDNTVIKIANNISKFIKTKDSNVFNLSYKLLITLTEKYLLDYTKNFFICFTESKMDMEVFKMILHSNLEAGTKFHLLAIIADNSSLNYLIEQYNLHEINDDYIDSFKNFMALENNELLKEFNLKLKNETEYKELAPKRNYEEERKKQRNREIEMFYNKEIFEKEISLVFEIEKKERLSYKDIREIEIKNWEKSNYASKALQIIENFSREENVNLEKIIKSLSKCRF